METTIRLLGFQSAITCGAALMFFCNEIRPTGAACSGDTTSVDFWERDSQRQWSYDCFCLNLDLFRTIIFSKRTDISERYKVWWFRWPCVSFLVPFMFFSQDCLTAELIHLKLQSYTGKEPQQKGNQIFICNEIKRYIYKLRP